MLAEGEERATCTCTQYTCIYNMYIRVHVVHVHVHVACSCDHIIYENNRFPFQAMSRLLKETSGSTVHAGASDIIYTIHMLLDVHWEKKNVEWESDCLHLHYLLKESLIMRMLPF